MSELKRDELLTKLRALRPTLERDGVKHMTLFGSRARMDHRADSDVDLMIEVDDTKSFSMLDLVGIGHVVEDGLGLQANIFMKRSVDKPFLDETKPDLVSVF